MLAVIVLEEKLACMQKNPSRVIYVMQARCCTGNAGFKCYIVIAKHPSLRARRELRCCPRVSGRAAGSRVACRQSSSRVLVPYCTSTATTTFLQYQSTRTMRPYSTGLRVVPDDDVCYKLEQPIYTVSAICIGTHILWGFHCHPDCITVQFGYLYAIVSFHVRIMRYRRDVTGLAYRLRCSRTTPL